MDKSGFSVCLGKESLANTTGFKLYFPNNYGISVVFGGISDSDSVEVKETSNRREFFCKTAEVAVLNSKGEIVPFPDNMVKTNVTPEELPQIISWAMNR